MNEKVCSKCKERKPLAAFHRHSKNKDGHQSYCKACSNVAARSASRTRLTASNKRPATAGQRERRQQRRLRTVGKIQANRAVANAVKKGVLVRQPCEVCGATKVHAHHDDYSKLLDVRWLCPAHHTEWHKTHPQMPNLPPVPLMNRRPITLEQARAIKASTESSSIVAKRVSLCKASVNAVRRGERWPDA